MGKIKLLFALCIYLLVGCKKEEEVPMLTPIAEPSIVAHELSYADSEERGFLYYEAVTDTILERNPFDREYRLTAPKGYKSYEWKIGNNQPFTTSENEVEGYAPYNKDLGAMPIRLIVKGDMYERFPNGTNVDTVYKTMVTLPNSQSKLKGKYMGTLIQFEIFEQTPNVEHFVVDLGTKTIEIIEKPAPLLFDAIPYLVITGLGEYAPCPDQEGLRLRWGYQSFSMVSHCGGRRYKGYGKLSAKNDSISFEYRPWADSRWYRFIGNRVP